jgi:hypothetical protein
LEVIAVEYYSNKFEDDIENGIVGKLIVEPEDPNEEDNQILGDTFIKLKRQYSYRFNGRISAEWKVDKKYPVQLEFDKSDPRNVSVVWTAPYSGQFELFYGDYKKTIVVESLF